MSGSDRWTRVAEQLAVGEPLPPEDARWVEAMRAADPACAAELAVLDALHGWEDADPDPSASTSAAALVRAALAEVDRVEAGSEASPIARPRPRWWLAVPAVAAAAAIALAVLLFTDGTTTSTGTTGSGAITLARGEVFVDGHPIASASAELEEGATLAVGDGAACFRLDRQVDVCLDAATTATIRALHDDARIVEVLDGHAVARLSALENGRSFSLLHGDVTAKAIGTAFSLDVDAEAATVTASVLHGTVWVAVAGDGIELAARQTVVVRDGRLERGTLVAEQEAHDLALLGAALHAERDDQVGRILVECVPPATVVLDGVTVGRSPVLARAPVGDHRVELVRGDAVVVEETLAVEADATTRRRFELPRTEPEPADVPVDREPLPGDAEASENGTPPIDPEPALGDEIPDAAVDDAAARAPIVRKRARPADVLLAQARRERQDGRWTAAASAYAELVEAHPRSAEARTALVSLGDLQLDRLNKPRAAARSYARYLARGGGPLAQEARYGRVRAYRAAGEPAQERRAIEAFLEQHPSSARVGELKSRLRELRAMPQ